MNVSINFVWVTTSLLAVHTGLARAGGVDRTVRKRRKGQKEVPELPGEAVKAVIREAAERILRWQNKNTNLEKPDQSIPTDPAIARLFAPQWGEGLGSQSKARYFFGGALGESGTEQDGVVGSMELLEITSTKIDQTTGTAADNTLRSVESWKPGVQFKLQIEGVDGDWSAGSPDLKDLHLLLMAILSADAIGGGWSIGRGGLSLSKIECRTDAGQVVDIAAILRGDPSNRDFPLANWLREVYL
jgi:CRISPR/Cas system CSM-associated protein Csm3 (group 7 of RAMP superfamily)